MRAGSAAGELTSELLIAAYGKGIFPMVGASGAIEWHQPDPRAIFELERISAPDRATRRLLEHPDLSITVNLAFEEVMRGCADREETWIDARMIAAYTEIHRQGIAHSLEVRMQRELIGGVYGVALGGAFFGESLFGVNNSGKVAFHALVQRLLRNGFVLFDTQYMNPFTEQLGAIEIPRSDFSMRLEHALQQQARFR